MATYNIGGFDFTNDAGGIRRADGKPLYNTFNFANPPSWGEINQSLKSGDTSVLAPELRPYASQLSGLNDQIASTENYDTGFNGFMNKAAPGIILGLGGAGIASELGGGSFFNNIFSGGTDAPWGVNPQGAGMPFDPLADFGPDYFSGAGDYAGALKDLSALPAPTNLQDLMTKLDSTPSGKSLLNSLTGGSSDAAGASSILSKILGSGGGTGTDWASILGKLGAAGLGAYGSNQQANSLSNLANQYLNFGAPSRARFEASMSPGFDPMSIPGYSGALDSTSKSVLAGLAAKNGNPFGNPGGLIDANKQIVAGTALPAINEYQRLNANTGFGSSMNAAVPLQTQAIGQEGNVLNSLGYGLNAVTNPQPSLADMIKALNLQGLA